MGLPDPVYSFTIPSVHDDTPLDCRIYHPQKQPDGHAPNIEYRRKRGAIVAHPYAPLGGCYDDHVVLVVAGQLLKNGFVVGTFNFRGAGTSKGRTSWAGKAEVADYVSFAGFFAHYLSMLDNPASTVRLTGTQQSSPYLMPGMAASHVPSQHETMLASAPEQVQLILGGYSYGSLVVTHLPFINLILERFSQPKGGTAEAEILLRAHSLASQSNAAFEEQERMKQQCRQIPSKHSHSVTLGGEESSPEARRISREERRSGEGRLSLDIPRKIKALRSRSSERSVDGNQATSLTPTMPVVSVCYLLISPLLPPLSSIIAPSLAFTPWTTKSKEQKQLVEHLTMAVYGDKDKFTSAKKLRSWAQKLAAESDSRFQFEEIAGAGHFWQERDAQAKLKDAVSCWVSGVTQTPSKS